MRKINYICMVAILLIFIFITIQPLPFIGEDYIILPGVQYRERPLSDFFPVLFSLDGITTYTGAGGPLYYVFYTFYSFIGGDVRWHYNLLNICILAINFFFLWQWFRKTEEAEQKYMPWALAAIIFFTFSIPVWQVVAAASSAPGATSSIFPIVSLFTYFFYYRKTDALWKNCFFLLIILLFTRMGILMKGEGRLIFVIIFLYLFTISVSNFIRSRRAKEQLPPNLSTFGGSLQSLPLFQKKNMLLLILLFFLCIPAISLLISFGGRSSGESSINHVYKTDILYDYLPLLFSLRPSELGEGFIHSDYGFYYQLFLKMLYPWRVYSFLAVVLIIFSLGFWYISIKHNKEGTQNTELHHLCLFSGIWFMITLSAIEAFRGLTGVHYYYNWMIIDLYPAMFPGSIFVISCVWMAYSNISSISSLGKQNKQKFYKIVLVFFLVLLLTVKVITMLTWSGGFLDNVVGFFHTADYVSEYDTSGVSIVFHQGPMYVYGGETILGYNFPAITSIEGGCPKEEEINESLIYKKYLPEEIKNIFILSNNQIEACENIELVTTLSPRSDSLYYSVKNMLGLSKKTYIYHIFK